MKTVWKYALVSHEFIVDGEDDLIPLDIPVGWKLLHHAMVNNVPTIWALVDTEAPRVVARFLFTCTGDAMDGKEKAYPGISERFLGTFLMDHGLLVFHAWQVDESNQ